MGPSQCGKFDVLWISSDFEAGESRNAAAWIPRHQIRGKTLQLALLAGLFSAEKTHLELDEPNFSKIAPSPKAVLTGSEVSRVAADIFDLASQ